MDLCIVADTHVPSRAPAIPDGVRDRIAAADHVIHAGDFDAKGALADVQDLASDLTAVAGNMDPAIGLPEVATVTLGGVTFVVTHGTGPSRGYEDRVATAVRDAVEDPTAAVGVAGHTHEPLDVVHDGVRLLNPGSATGAAPADRATLLEGTVADGDLDLSLVEL